MNGTTPRPALSDDEAVAALRASWRQVSHAYSEYLEAMTEVGNRSDPTRAACEIEAALTFTGRRADYEHTFARTLVERLPLVLEALRSGAIDHHKARVFAEYLADLTDAQIALICGRLLPLAPGWTTGQLAHRLLREVAAVDHHHTRRRYQRAVAERGVSGFLAPDGTATITAHGLTPTEAAAAAGRLDALAAAVRRAGHPDTIHQIRADLFIRLLDGRYNGFTTDQIVAAMLADGFVESTKHTPSTEPTDQRDSADDDIGTPCEPADLHAPDGSDPDGGTGTEVEGNTGGGSDSGSESRDHDDEEGPEAPTEGLRHGVEIRIGLTTLLGLDQHPAELPGWGPVLAQDARLLVHRQHTAEWCFAITDTDGYLLHGGITRTRPRTATIGACQGGAVEIHISESRLAALADSPDLPPGWAPFVADLARRHATWRARPGDRDACLDEQPRARLPHLGLRRHVRLRDRTCVAPGCRRPARKADQDHTRDHILGGATVRANLAPLCERHHLMKHDGGWSLAQPGPGRFVWCSPLRQTYRTRGDPIAPDLPDPLPGNDHDDAHCGRRYDGPIFPRGPDLSGSRRSAGPPTTTDDDAPPF